MRDSPVQIPRTVDHPGLIAKFPRCTWSIPGCTPALLLAISGQAATVKAWLSHKQTHSMHWLGGRPR